MFATFNCGFVLTDTGKVKVVPVIFLTEHYVMKEYLEEWRYSSTHSLALALGGVSGQLHAPPALPPGKEPLVPIG